MRKFITVIGLSAVTTATLAFTAAGPATALPSPTSAAGLVCAALPVQSAANTVSLGALNTVLSAANTDFGTKSTAFGVTQTGLVTALVNYLKAYDSGTNVAAKNADLQSAIGTYSGAASAWVNAWNAQDMANRGVQVAMITQNLLNGLQASTLCV